MSRAQQIVAIGLLTQHELELLGQGFDRAFPIDEAEQALKSRGEASAM